MTPKEKAIELIELFKFNCRECDNSKISALIAVNEMIQEVYNISHKYTAIYDEKTKFYSYTQSKELKFWIEVKQEIEKL